ncbi:hypothetical protein [Leifsonia sp. Leaf336]|uniref:hypothetical protein n=1 Tax=Leifsonia sp. Leaf336 TaxID=1736341 RepID=UPI0012FCCDA0|nr:hypothetical protein [Leifsonia sp. Leaf336]
MSDLVNATFSMFRGDDLITLSDILGSIKPKSKLEWVVKILDVTTESTSSLDVLELESRIAASAGKGIRLTDEELATLAEEIHQVIDCDLAGFMPDAPATQGQPAVVIEAFDSSQWTISVDTDRVAMKFVLE